MGARAGVSKRVLEAMRVFGVTTGSPTVRLESGVGRAGRTRVDRVIASFADRLVRRAGAAGERGAVVVVSGASGSGKSTVVSRFCDQFGGVGSDARVVRVRRVGRSDRRVIETVRGPVERALGVLARAGLAEAGVLMRAVGVLSAGERARLGLARAMSQAERISRAGGSCVVVCDDFGEFLDGRTAENVARSLARWARSGGRRVLVATTRHELARVMEPDVHVHLPGWFLEHGTEDAWRAADARGC